MRGGQRTRRNWREEQILTFFAVDSSVAVMAVEYIVSLLLEACIILYRHYEATDAIIGARSMTSSLLFCYANNDSSRSLPLRPTTTTATDYCYFLLLLSFFLSSFFLHYIIYYYYYSSSSSFFLLLLSLLLLVEMIFLLFIFHQLESRLLPCISTSTKS